MPSRSYSTQWAAQFAVASELCKRLYEVSIAQGNLPSVDLMVRSPKGISFGVDVKGLYKENYFPLTPKIVREDLFYALVFVPPDAQNQFFLLSQADANEEVRMAIEQTRAKQIAKGGTGEKAGAVPAISWAAAQRYKDRWETFPA